MKQCVMLVVLLAHAASCTAVRREDNDLLRSRTGSTEDGLSIRLGLDVTTVAPGDMLPAKLFVRAFDADKKPAHLLEGRFVCTFVPVGAEASRPACSTVTGFSGGGGVDYSGTIPLELRVTAPLEAGQYLFFVTVLSTQDDIDAFQMSARMSGRDGPWWIGNLSTPAIPIAVSPGASGRLR